MSRSLASLLILLWALSPIALAQEQPRFVLNPNGPVSPVQALAFSADSSRLYSAGFDKVVHSWKISVSRRTGTVNRNLAQTLRWEISRGQRGVIYAIAASPTTRDLAIGGASARGRSGTIVLYDSEAAQVREALLAENHGTSALAWAPDGSRLASTSVDGELYDWSGPQLQPRRVRSAQSLPGSGPGKSDAVYPLVFLSPTLLATGEPVGAGPNWRIVAYNLAAPQPMPVPMGPEHPFGVLAMARHPKNAQWATCDGAGNVYLWNGPDLAQQPRLLKQGFPAGALAFGPEGILFALGIPYSKGSLLQMWDLNTGNVLDSTDTGRMEQNSNCLAMSPDERWLATVGGDDGPVQVFQLRDAKGQLLPKPLGGDLPPVRIRGAGQRMGRVAFAAPAKTPLRANESLPIAFGPLDRFADINAAGYIANQYGALNGGFDLKQGVLLDAASIPKQSWLPPGGLSGGYDIHANPKNIYQLLVRIPGQARDSTITLNPDRQGRMMSYCWLAQPGQSPWGIAIGTDHQNGIFIYKTVYGGEFPLLRYFRDHVGWVTSISVSPDGRYLASASVDQTIKLWSLSDVGLLDRRFRQAAAWGAVFVPAAKGLIVESVVPDSISDRRGFKPKDRIEEVHLAAQRVPPRANAKSFPHPQLPGTRIIADPAAMLAALEDLPIYEQPVLKIAGRKELIQLVPAWEPLASLFVANNNEWALATPQGFYDASPGGDGLIGWQINRGERQTPQFLAADQLRKQLERADILRSLFAKGNLPAAKELAPYFIPSEGLAYLVSTLASRNVPQIVSMLPGDASDIGHQRPLIVTAKVQYPQILDPKGYRYRLYVNGVPHDPQPPIPAGEHPETVSFAVQAPTVDNAINVTIESLGEQTFASRGASVRASASSQAKPKLYVLTLAAAQYKNAQQQLQFTVKDAGALLETLQKHSAGLYAVMPPRSLHDEALNQASLDQALQQLAQDLKNAGPDDLLVVFVAGHGELEKDLYYFVPTHVDLEDRAMVAEQGIRWEKIQELAALPCKTMFLLDTCNSGNVFNAIEAKRAIRPLAHSIVMTATAANQVAQGFANSGQGLFTQMLLEGLVGQADRDRNALIDALEAANHVRTRVPVTSAQQTPLIYIPESSGLSDTPLTRYNLAAPVAGGGNEQPGGNN